jgi:carbamoyltransferase
MNKYILGIWGYSADSPAKTHDSGAALIRNGRILAAINEERLSRIKTDGTYPFKSIKEVLRIANISPEEVDIIALAGLPPRKRAFKMLKYIFKTFFDTKILLPNRILYALLTAKKLRRTVPVEIEGKKIVYVEHHAAHAASAYYTSPWRTSTVITLDGIGDSSICGTVNIGRKGRIERLWECNGYYSPGIFYSFITKYFGFKPSRHEGKITGLAAYGKAEKCYQEIKATNSYNFKKHDFYSTYIPKLFSGWSVESWEMPIIDELMDRVFREDIAAATQRLTEEVVCKFIEDGVKETKLGNLSLAGGVFGNVRLNQRIRELESVNNVYIHPNMSDGGLAAGAALYVWAQEMIKEDKEPHPQPLETAYLGPQFSDQEIKDSLNRYGLKAEYYENVEEVIADYISRKRLVGRFSGRMEYGPRALGNRSILADPTDIEINDWLNKRLKRTEFMPFAPVILEEAASQFYLDWQKDHIASRFMTMTYDTTDKAKRLAPAVVHVDGTTRPQIIREKDNPSYYKILKIYQEKTGLPLFVNTSFNMHEEPIVCTPEDAIRSFLAGSVDVLALEKFIVKEK